MERVAKLSAGLLLIALAAANLPAQGLAGLAARPARSCHQQVPETPPPVPASRCCVAGHETAIVQEPVTAPFPLRQVEQIAPLDPTTLAADDPQALELSLGSPPGLTPLRV